MLSRPARPKPHRSFLVSLRAVLLLGMRMDSDTLLPDKTIALLCDIFLVSLRAVLLLGMRMVSDTLRPD